MESNKKKLRVWHDNVHEMQESYMQVKWLLGNVGQRYAMRTYMLSKHIKREIVEKKQQKCELIFYALHTVFDKKRSEPRYYYGE